jgi:hypothetical protein
MLLQVEEHCPGLLPYFYVCYRGLAHMYLSEATVPATSGVHQGDPLRLLLFAIAIHPLIASLGARFSNQLHAWFLDDGSVVGEADGVMGVLSAVIRAGPDSWISPQYL